MAKPLIVNAVELLRRPGTTKDIDVAVAVLDFEFDDARIVDTPVDISVHLESLSTGIHVSGTAHATWAGGCRRCLGPLVERMRVDLDEMYQKGTYDPDAYEIENDQINLLPMIREGILLAVPLSPLCREDCPGFCPQCGADLSETPCGCVPSASDPRWSALENLKGVFPDDTP
ncbi:MAG: hypothetical protein CK521_05860 [Acidimicrobium sp.]|nr:DUF177 domain-containing protein [Ilumatobacteraceae bacterium]PHX70970.1 MAG: hypothetical protein CK521_05860 [Acidimicrobium sp.]